MSASITYLPESGTFFLQSQNTAYAFRVIDYGYVEHLYWGPAIEPQALGQFQAWRDRAFSPNPVPSDRRISLDWLAQEFPANGNTDYRSPAVELFQPADGSPICDFRYKSHRIEKGKPSLEGLPATFAGANDATTLILELEDEKLALKAELLYTVFSDYPVITRSARLSNSGKDTVQVRRLLSASVDFSSNYADYQLIQLSGAWARERDLIASPLRPGIQSLDSKRGASSHQQHPFIALAELGADEEHGQVFGFNLVYSGNFLASVELDSHKIARAQIGLNPHSFCWKLAPGQSFQSPEAVLVFSPNGLGEMSRSLHRFYRGHLINPQWANKPRPILVNNWEATYFDFNADKLEKIAKAGAGIGLELFVLDDGWFGKRNDDTTSLGDWVVDRNKLPGGLEDLVARINGQGLQFGLWFEPEMISRESDLYRAHPDWCLHVPGRVRSEGRTQLILDFSRREVREEIERQMSAILRSAPITYVKWDMNRHMTEVGSAALPADQQGETAHRYMLGLYETMAYFVREFPNVLFEGCSGGGGRFDPGILYYMPQIWTSDDSDAIARLRIQYGTSLVYPLSAISAHVSVVPNHQIGRVTPFATRGDVAMTGTFGYELDLGALSPEDKQTAVEQVVFYKKVRGLLTSGDLYRLKSPFTSQESAWIVVSPDKKEALATHVTILAEPNPPVTYLRLRGLAPERKYRVEGTDEIYCGDALMQIGLLLAQPKGDFVSVKWHLVAVD
jgi:alpha-galactosidase